LEAINGAVLSEDLYLTASSTACENVMITRGAIINRRLIANLVAALALKNAIIVRNDETARGTEKISRRAVTPSPEILVSHLRTKLLSSCVSSPYTGTLRMSMKIILAQLFSRVFLDPRIILIPVKKSRPSATTRSTSDKYSTIGGSVFW